MSITQTKHGSFFGALIYMLFPCFFAFSEEVTYENNYRVKVSSFHATALPPSIFRDNWMAIGSIRFDNSLHGDWSTEWKHESQASQMASIYSHQKSSKYVNIIPSKTIVWDRLRHRSFDSFSIKLFIFVDQNNDTHWVDLYIDKNKLTENLPEVVKIDEDIETISGWIYDDHNYTYIIELSDGTKWKTKSQNKTWSDQWNPGDKVLKIGNSQNFCLINIDSVTDRNIREKNYLGHLTLLKS